MFLYRLRITLFIAAGDERVYLEPFFKLGSYFPYCIYSPKKDKVKHIIQLDKQGRILCRVVSM